MFLQILKNKFPHRIISLNSTRRPIMRRSSSEELFLLHGAILSNKILYNIPNSIKISIQFRYIYGLYIQWKERKKERNALNSRELTTPKFKCAIHTEGAYIWYLKKEIFVYSLHAYINYTSVIHLYTNKKRSPSKTLLIYRTHGAKKNWHTPQWKFY